MKRALDELKMDLQLAFSKMDKTGDLKLSKEELKQMFD
jgi:hypothetical protein